MSTKEKQATLKAAFVFLVPLENEQPAKAGDRARQRVLVIEEEKREHERKTSDAESGICFSRAIRERAACEAGGRARQPRARDRRRAARAGTAGLFIAMGEAGC